MSEPELDDDELLLQDDVHTDLLDLSRGDGTNAQGISDVVKNFILFFHRLLGEKNLYDLHSIYENYFPKLTDRFFRNTSWPGVSVVGPLVDNDPLFLMLYRELFYRHLFAIKQATFQQRIEAWENYCSFFTLLLTAATPVALELPNQWLWDIVDEFVSQFQSFRRFVETSAAALSEPEAQALKANPRVWNARDVMFYLNEFVGRSNAVAVLQAEQRQAPIDELRQIQGAFGSKNLYRLLGFFSIVCLSRVHCLLGDYYMALKTLDPLEVNQKRLYSRTTASQISMFYHLGFACLMCRRYPDAIKAFSTILLFIWRSRGGAAQTRPYAAAAASDHAGLFAERMYSLLAIAISLCPQRLEESLNNALWENYGDRILRMQRGETAVFSDLFESAAPAFVSASDVDFTGTAIAASPATDAASPDAAVEPSSTSSSPSTSSRAARLQQRMFLAEISQQILIPTIRSYLKLYTTIDVAKLAHFLDIDVKQVIQHMISFKHKAQTKRWHSDAAHAPAQTAAGDLRFYFQQDMIHISSEKGPRRYSNYYIRQISKFDEILHDLKTKKEAPAPAI